MFAGKTLSIVTLTLQDTPESFHRPVVNTLRYAGHTLRHPGFFQLVMEGSVCVLKATVRMEDGVCIRVFLHSPIKGFEYKRIVVSVSNHKGDDTPVIEIQNGTEINLVDFNTFIPLKFGYIREPLLVGCFGMKIPVQYILCNVLGVLGLPCAAAVAVLDRGLDIFLPADPQDSFIVDVDVMVMTEIVIDTAITLVRAFRMDLLDLFGDCFVLSGSGTFTAGNPPVIRRSRHLQHLTGFFNGISAF